jgi:hypothetical protein
VAPTASQLRWRGRIEAMLRVVGPALDLLLAAGDRLSRRVGDESRGVSQLPAGADDRATSLASAAPRPWIGRPEGRP